ncbi:hypothetical protein FQR65_LT09962 [Abscondita terminalis]|nr:hypothetical protein FQR65_LT09962 [Abscondita terminalis]
MKSLLLFLICYVSSSIGIPKINPIFLARVQTIKERCIEESRANLILVERMLQLQDFSDDENVKCFQLCVFARVNAMTASGEVSGDLIMSELPVDESVPVDDIINKCQYLKGKNACETAHQMWKCFVKFTD